MSVTTIAEHVELRLADGVTIAGAVLYDHRRGQLTTDWPVDQAVVGLVSAEGRATR